MELTLEQVARLAPDEKSVASARQLLGLQFWNGLGLHPEAVWGNCRGSATYRVRIDLSNLGQSCNCPSRKRPCRHSLGLLMLLAKTPDALPIAEVPDDVREWLDKRQQRANRQADAENTPAKPVDEAGRQKRVARREERIQEGIDRLQLWMNDLIRTGLAGLETKGFPYFEEQAKRLVDAQAPGLAGRVRSLGEIPGSSPNWPLHLLDGLGRLQLLMTAYTRLSELDEPLQAEIRQLVGWTVSQAELDEFGEKVADKWIVVGQREEDDDRLRTQRTWLQSATNGRMALVLQFAPGQQPFLEAWVPGTVQTATLLFYPGSLRQRARSVERGEAGTTFQGRLVGSEDIESFLNSYAAQLALQPWLGTFPGVLRNVTLTQQGQNWFVRDNSGAGLPIQSNEPWRLLAASGGQPVDLCGEWTGHTFRPLSMGLGERLMMF
ncbi:SWIM zinc finger family protein [Planctomicrobium piriforme]|uniref:SWIM zinc finger family protein n=1 Tax=Planctomicrobium piriforme TaxID=1576369 RepID=UPI0015877D0F|nr:SWIM zinc finger family protein [Planctomicrobium piriforme]